MRWPGMCVNVCTPVQTQSRSPRRPSMYTELTMEYKTKNGGKKNMVVPAPSTGRFPSLSFSLIPVDCTKTRRGSICHGSILFRRQANASVWAYDHWTKFTLNVSTSMGCRLTSCRPSFNLCFVLVPVSEVLVTLRFANLKNDVP